MDEGEGEGDADAVHKSERMYFIIANCYLVTIHHLLFANIKINLCMLYCNFSLSANN